MKKITTVLISICISSILFSQQSGSFGYQLSGGVTIAFPEHSFTEYYPQFEGHPVSYYDLGADYFIEATAIYHLSERIDIYGSIGYLNTKLNVIDSLGSLSFNGFYRTSQLSIPVMVMFRPLNKIPLQIGAGAYVSFLLVQKQKGTQYIDTTGFSENIRDPNDPLLVDLQKEVDYEISDHMNPVEFGLNAKMSYAIKINDKFSLVPFSKFNFGITEMSDFEIRTWKLRNLLIGIGLQI